MIKINDLAHELWAAAQLVPGEVIEDAVNRITNILLTRTCSTCFHRYQARVDSATGKEFNLECKWSECGGCLSWEPRDV